MPNINKLHVDQLLSNISVKYKNAEYIAMSVFPEVPVKKDSDLYRIYVQNFRIPETLRSNKGESREHQFDITNGSYLLKKHSLKDYISDDDADNYDIADLRADTTEELSDVILRRLEKDTADLFTSTNWSLNVSLAAASVWNANTTVSNPIPVVDTGASTILNNSGFMPNFMILPRDSFIAAKNHVSVLDRVKYVSSDMNVEMMKGLFDMEEILVPKSQIDTAAEGQASSISAIYGDNVFLGYKPPRASPRSPSSGYIFRKSIPMVKRWRAEERDSEAIEVNMKYDVKVVASLTGYLIKDTLA